MAKSKLSSLTEAMQKVSRPQLAEREENPNGKRKITVYLDPPMHRALRHLAANRDTSINAILIGLIAGELRKEGL
jgi:DNA-binding MarR family transcriptional regulator